MRTHVTRLLVGYLAIAVVVAADSGAAANCTASAASSARNSALDPVYYVKDLFINQIYRYIRFDSIDETVQSVQSGKYVEVWPTIQTILAAVAPIAACIITGILFCVIMPIVGLCCCCCRLCGNCGGKAPEMDPPNAKCKRVTCGFLLLVLTTLMLFGVVETFLSIDELNRQLQPDPGSAICQVNPLLGSMFDKVKDAANLPAQSLQQLGPQVTRQLSASGADVFRNLTGVPSDFPTATQQLLSESARNISELSRLLGIIVSSEQSISLMQQELTRCCNSDLNCTVLANTNYTQFDVNQLQQLINDSVSTLAEASIGYSQLNGSISDKISSASADISTLITNLQNLMENFAKSLNVDHAKSTVKLSDSLSAEISRYSKYVLYGGFGLGSVVALVAFLLYLALCCGLCGRRAGDDSSSCSKGSGASVLVAATALMFIFSWIIMFVALSLFPSSVAHLPCWLVGGTLSSKIDHFSKLSQYKLDISLFGKEHAYTVDDFDKTFRNCQGNSSLYSVMGILFPEVEDMITNINNRSRWAIPGLEDLSITLPEKINDTANGLTSVRSSLRNLNATVMELLKVVNQSPFTPGLNSLGINETAAGCNITRANLTWLANETAATLTELQWLTPAVHVGLLNAITSVEQAQNGAVALLARAKGGAVTPGDVMNRTIDGLQKTANDTLNAYQCKELLYVPVKAVADLVCSNILDPLDAFWFSLGWSVVLFVLLICVSLYLVSLYRRQEPFKARKDRFEDEGYGEDDGITIRDSVPLDNMPAPRKLAAHRSDAAYSNAAYYGSHGDASEAIPPPYYGAAHDGRGRRSSYNGGNFPRVVQNPTNSDVSYGGPAPAVSRSQKRY